MKYLTEKITKEVIYNNKPIKLVGYCAKNAIEELYYLQPPPEPTFEKQIEHLIVKMFFGVEGYQNKRLRYYFNPHEFLRVHGVDHTIKAAMLTKLWNTLSYFPKDRVDKYIQDIKIYIETFTPDELPPQPINKKKPKLNRSLIIFKNSETIDKIHFELKGYFPNKEAELLKALQGKQLSEVLVFPHNGNRFVEVFKRLRYNGFLVSTPTEIKSWICKNFKFTKTQGAKNTVEEFKENSVWDVLTKTKSEPSKKNRICTPEWLPFIPQKIRRREAENEKL